MNNQDFKEVGYCAEVDHEICFDGLLYMFTPSCSCCLDTLTNDNCCGTHNEVINGQLQYYEKCR